MKNWLPLVFGPVFTMDKQPLAKPSSKEMGVVVEQDPSDNGGIDVLKNRKNGWYTEIY